MKHLIILFTAALLMGCNQTTFDRIQGEWTVIEMYDTYQDFSYALNSSNNKIEFTEDEIPFADGTIYYRLKNDAGWMGNQGVYIIIDDVIHDNLGARFTIEWINNNKIKLVSLVASGKHLILTR